MEEKSEQWVLPPNIFGQNRAVVTAQYSVMPRAGILASQIPGIDKTTIRIQTAPPMGARFAQLLLELESGGGTTTPREEAGIQHFFYVLKGTVRVAIDDRENRLSPHGYAYVPVGRAFAFRADEPAELIWIKKPYEAIDLEAPEPLAGHRDEVERTRPHTEGRYWQYLLPLDDLRFDMHVNILGFTPGTYFPYVETHIMEHGLYMLEVQWLYLLGREWHEAVVDDFIWMASYCPQLFYCTGWGEAAYLLYKDVNRDVRFD
jgi:(S)-ureidoglycine aminohydrolase